MLTKIPHQEINCIPSQLNTSPVTGVAAQLASAAENAPQFDGVTIEQMQNNPLYQRIDDIDKVGLAQQRIIDNTKTLKSRASRIRQFNDIAQKIRKPGDLPVKH